MGLPPLLEVVVYLENSWLASLVQEVLAGLYRVGS